MLTRTRKAFTLLELIVVIVVLGILAAIAVPTFAAVIEKSRQNTAQSAAESIGRNAYALTAFNDGSTLSDNLDTAAAEANQTVEEDGDVLVDGRAFTLKFDGAKVTAEASKVGPNA